MSPLAAQQEIRIKLPTTDPGQRVTLYLAAGTAGDGNAKDLAVWRQPRIVTPGQPDLRAQRRP